MISGLHITKIRAHGYEAHSTTLCAAEGGCTEVFSSYYPRNEPEQFYVGQVVLDRAALTASDIQRFRSWAHRSGFDAIVVECDAALLGSPAAMFRAFDFLEAEFLAHEGKDFTR